MVSSSRVYPYQRTTFIKDGPNPIRRSMQSTVGSHSFALKSFERLCLLEGDIGTLAAEFVCGRVRVCRWRKKLVDFGMVGALNNRAMDTASGIAFLCTIAVRTWKLISWKGSKVQSKFFVDVGSWR